MTLAPPTSRSGGGGIFDAFAYVHDARATDTGGGDFLAGAWRTRPLTTIVEDTGIGLSLVGNVLTVPAADYWIAARAPAYSTGAARHKAVLWDNDANALLLDGSSAYCGADDQSDSWVHGVISLPDETAVTLRHQIQTTENTLGFGVDSNFGVDEIYAEITFWRMES